MIANVEIGTGALVTTNLRHLTCASEQAGIQPRVQEIVLAAFID